MRRLAVAVAGVALVLSPVPAQASGGAGRPVAGYGGLTASQQATLLSVARDTWNFYNVDVDPGTHLPLDNITFAGGSATPTAYGRYTSASNIGVYLWAVVAANDLGLISRPQARARISATLAEVQTLKRFDGFLYQWYDTTNGDVIRNPGDIDCATETTPTFDNCYFISNVDNGWYASGLIVVLMANEVVPETSWGPRSFGLADARTANVQITYATQQLHYPVWGMSPSSTADDSGGYGGFGVEGLQFPYYGTGANASHPNEGLSQCHGCATEDVVTPHASFIALDVAPQQAYANIEALRTLYPGVYGRDGFFDAVNPVTGVVGHRDLVLDQSMIMAAVDNALENRAIQRYFADDPVSWAARTYLSIERMSL